MLKGDLSLRNGRGPTGEVSKVALVTLLHDSIFPEQEPESSQKKWEATGWAATPTSGRGRGWEVCAALAPVHVGQPQHPVTVGGQAMSRVPS